MTSTRQRIAEQHALVARLEPGTRQHRIAVELLLLFQDSLHVLTGADEILDRCNRDLKGDGRR